MPDARSLPPDQPQRIEALDTARSILVQAPAGSGKTDLLTRRFLRLLAQVDDPSQIVAITFTRAAAAEMRHRILSELEKASVGPDDSSGDPHSVRALARLANSRSLQLGWNLVDLPAQLRIGTIDSFCREIALQQPILTGLGGRLDINNNPGELYLRAARRTLLQLDSHDPELATAIRTLLLWRDNNLAEMESLLVQMLADRDRWMHDFVLDREPDWDALRATLEQSFTAATRTALESIHAHFDQVPGGREELLWLARFASTNENGEIFQPLAELPDFPAPPYSAPDDLHEAHEAWLIAASLILTNGGEFRKSINTTLGFPAHRKSEKARHKALVSSLATVPGLESALARLRDLPPPRYTDDDWRVLRASFILLRRAAAELHTVFAESGQVDYTQVAQIAQQVLLDSEGQPTEAALAIADNIHHLLVDEFQDTSRRQHRLVASLVAAWPSQEGRTLFVVGDPMQSIYFFRDADAELFPQVRDLGLELPTCESFRLHHVPLTANFRTDPALVTDLNGFFSSVFEQSDGSGVTFTAAAPARDPSSLPPLRRHLHCTFMPGTRTSGSTFDKEQITQLRTEAAESQLQTMLSVIQSHMPLVAEAHSHGTLYRIAVLARKKKHLASLALVLHENGIPFRAVELEDLRNRPEILDALALARALLNPFDRVAWFGLLRAPWCGLSLADLHILAGEDTGRSIRTLLVERAAGLSPFGQSAVQRLTRALDSFPDLRARQPLAALGTTLQQIWLSLGGAACVDATALANLDLLWSCLDALPAGESDLLGSALDIALSNLTAVPDPAASSEDGVQLMTIHKSKGLEFEVVLVPELQARTAGNSSVKLLSWLERGLAEPTSDGAVTEFLVAPIQTKGAERSNTKTWVDKVRADREKQELRRLLYVAATRARDELHIFARPEYKFRNGAPQLAEPSNTLLATAWPALDDEISAQFEAWSARQASQESADQTLETVFATQENSAADFFARHPAILRRLPTSFEPPALPASYAVSGGSFPDIATRRLYERHQGGILSRVLGTIVHTLFEELSRLCTPLEMRTAVESLRALQPRLAAQARAAGLMPSQATSLVTQAFDFIAQSAADPIAQWILTPHPGAESEAAWTGVLSGSLRTVRIDRAFRAGPQPLSSGNEIWWIVDYKTAHADSLDPAQALPELRTLFAPQLEAYASVLRLLHGPHTQLRAALYYPRLLKFDWWEIV